MLDASAHILHSIMKKWGVHLFALFITKFKTLGATVSKRSYGFREQTAICTQGPNITSLSANMWSLCFLSISITELNHHKLVPLDNHPYKPQNCLERSLNLQVNRETQFPPKPTSFLCDASKFYPWRRKMTCDQDSIKYQYLSLLNFHNFTQEVNIRDSLHAESPAPALRSGGHPSLRRVSFQHALTWKKFNQSSNNPFLSYVRKCISLRSSMYLCVMLQDQTSQGTSKISGEVADASNFQSNFALDGGILENHG